MISDMLNLLNSLKSDDYWSLQQLTFSVRYNDHSPRQRSALLLTDLTCTSTLQGGVDHTLHTSVYLT